MIPTVDFLQEAFDRFNLLCFQGKLPPVPIQLSKARTYVGVCACRKQRKWPGKTVYSDFRLRFSTRWDLPEPELEDTVIHEMIHYWIWLSGIKDTSAHGKVFRSMMADINARFGRHITVSHRTTREEREKMVDTRRKPHVVALVFFKDGRTGLKLLPRKADAIARYRRGVLLSGRVSRIELYLSEDPWFNRFPTSSALNVIWCNEAEVREHLGDAERS